MKINLTRVFWGLIICLMILIFAPEIRAEEPKIIQTRYFDTYSLDYTTDVSVRREIQLINASADLYVSEYELTFSNYSELANLQIFEESQKAEFSQTGTQDTTQVRIKFNDPAIGRGAIKKLIIDYTLKNYLNQSGVHRELLIPLSSQSQQEELLSYDVEINTPPDYPQAGISKPKVQQTSRNSYQWTNLAGLDLKALYLSFSDRAYYKTTLNYVLSNSAPYPRKMEIVLVPDGTFQKSYLESISPLPQDVYTDEDGNLLAVYKVASQTALKIQYRGYVELFTVPRKEVRQYFQSQFKKVLNTRYLTQEHYWSLSPQILADKEISDLSGPLSIYDYIISKLDYDTARINEDLKRKGATWIYQNPLKAVCMEYTDLFIALSREKGIPAREVVGYGITADENLLPLSFLGDVLHAWPEFYDSSRQIWRPIDPTWADTSGIDYYSSFDLSHIAFVYHGKTPDYPLPPGVYKLDPKSRDVLVEATSAIPEDKQSVSGSIIDNLTFNAVKSGLVKAQISSLSNVFLYEVKVKLIDKASGQVLGQKTLGLVEPLSGKLISFNIDPREWRFLKKGQLQLVANGKVLAEGSFRVLAPSTYYLQIYGLFLILPLGLLLFYYFIKWRF